MNAARRAARRGGLVMCALGLVALCAAGSARAQDEELVVPRTWSLKLGAFMPIGNGMKSQTSDVWWFGGIDYFPNFRYRPLNADVHFGLDGAWRSSLGRDVSSVSLSAKLIWGITPPESKVQVWGGAGLGIYFIKTPFLRDNTQPGLKFILGVDLNDRWFLEGDYDYVARFSDPLGNSLSADGVSAALGYHF